MSHLSQSLRDLTKERGLPAEYISEIINRDLSFVRRCLRGEKRPSLETLILWARALDSDRDAYRRDKVGQLAMVRRGTGRVPTALPRLVAAALADAAARLSRGA